ncbi:MAG TPA: CoA pyrophosphatase [Gammaproteobacteria bacterium]|nr:CoA pyrophosphatase [Gammaproteobacteria bacterium]
MNLKEIIERALEGTRPETDLSSAPRPFGDLPAELRPNPETLRSAAVLLPIIERPAGLTLMLTRRTEDLPEHPGQIALPGGRVEPVDNGILDAALRETEEETGLPRHFVRPVGYLAPYVTITRYVIVPVVGFVRPGFEYRADPTEVAEIFEVPLEFVLDAANHRRESRDFKGREVGYYVLPWRNEGREYRIWGATAAILVDFARQVAGLRSRLACF